jgi:hypothetical protein
MTEENSRLKISSSLMRENKGGDDFFTAVAWWARPEVPSNPIFPSGNYEV